MSTSKDCSICCETYNKSTHKKVCCLFSDCEFSACKTCIRTYLLGTTADPHCMNCKKGWDEKFLVENLNRSFCDKEYKKHRKQLLIDREISKLPETMHLAERQKKVNVEEEKLKEFLKEVSKLKKMINELHIKQVEIHTNIYYIKHGTDDKGNTLERRKFIMACPNDDCRGYLSTQYKCELCNIFTCPQCLELIGYSKTDPHECNPSNVASAELIKKETKACPSCGVRIFKISGCSQMWCTECKVAFDYTTGRIDTGVVHNPHYYTHMAQQNQGQAPRNPQDIVCGGLMNIHNFNHMFNKLKIAIKDPDEYTTLKTYFSDIHMTINHISHYDLPRIRNAVRNLQNGEELRINYILGKTTKAEIGAQIYRQDLKRKKQTELLHLYELLNVVGIENFNTLYEQSKQLLQNSTSDKLEEFVDEIHKKILTLNNLREYCNKEFAKISVTYNNKVTHITDLWKIVSVKYKISDLKIAS